MCPPHSQQESRYSTNATAGQKPRTSMPLQASHGYHSAPHTTHVDQVAQVGLQGQPPTHLQAPSPAPVALSTQTPADPLEQRILDLLHPYRDECFKEDDHLTVARERAALVLCGTLQPLNFTTTT